MRKTVAVRNLGGGDQGSDEGLWSDGTSGNPMTSVDEKRADVPTDLFCQFTRASYSERLTG